MAIRRKLKSERELVSDIHKTFRTFCYKQDCKNCQFREASLEGKDCEMMFLEMIMKKYFTPLDEEYIKTPPEYYGLMRDEEENEEI